MIDLAERVNKAYSQLSQVPCGGSALQAASRKAAEAMRIARILFI
tara:strand:+ start:1782 stop:1916 length:135 start_codon:yes stop_codon:yes gene_type:complete